MVLPKAKIPVLTEKEQKGKKSDKKAKICEATVDFLRRIQNEKKDKRFKDN